MTIKYGLLAITSLSFLAACQKDSPIDNGSPAQKPKEPQRNFYISLDPALKKDFFFQPGSYWVYDVDSPATKQDCTYVVSAGLQEGTYMMGPSGSGQGPTFYNYTTAIVNFSGHTQPTKYYLTGSTLYFYDAYGHTSAYLFSYSGGAVSGYEEHFTVFTIDSVTSYNDVYKVLFINHSGIEEEDKFIKDSTYFYISQDIGIVRKDLYQGNGIYKRYFLKKHSIVK